MSGGHPVFVVIGVWKMDPEKREIQRDGLARLAAGVSQAPGIVKGYWADIAADSTRSHTYIVFSDRDSAESFAADVRGNLDNQVRAGVTNISLDLAEISATT
jgi:hypothetical protein